MTSKKTGNLFLRALSTAWLLPLCIFLANFIPKILHVDDRPVSLDEPYSIFFCQFPPAEVIKELTTGNNPPLFELILHYWTRLFGISPLSVRFIPVLASALTAVMMFLAGRKFFGTLTGITAAALFSFSGMHFHFAFESRVYTLFTLFAAASVYYFFSLLREPGSKKYLILLSLSTLLLIYGHYFGLFVPFAEIVVSFLFLKNRAFIRSFYIAAGITFLLYLPMISVLYERFVVSKDGTWVQAPDSPMFYLYMIFNFFNGRQMVITLTYVLLIGVGLHLLFERKNLAGLVKEKILAGCWLLFLIPFTIMFVGSYKVPMFTDRYVLYCSIPLYLAVAGTIHMLYKKLMLINLEWVSTLVIVFAMSASLVISPEALYGRRIDQAVNETKKLLKEHPDASVIIYPFWMDKAFGYHYSREIFTDYRNFHRRLGEDHIYPVWSEYEADSVLKIGNSGKVIYFRDEMNIRDTLLDPLYRHFDTIYQIKYRQFYPLTSNIFYFEKQ